MKKQKIFDIQAEKVKYQKRQKRKQMARKLIIAVIGVALIGGLIYYRDSIFIRGNPAQVQSGANTQVGSMFAALPGDKAKTIDKSGNMITLLTDAKLYFYANSGEMQKSVQHGFIKPVSKSFESKVLTYDESAKKFRVDNKSGNLYEETLEQNIFFGEVSRNKNFAVVTDSTNYMSEMLIYNDQHKRIFKWSSLKPVIAMAFTNDSSGCVAAAIDVNGTKSVTELSFFDFKVSSALSTVQIDDFFLTQIKYTKEGNIICIGRTAAVLLDHTGKQISRYDFDETLICASYCGAENQTPVFAFKSIMSENDIVCISLNEKFEESGRWEAKGRFVDIVSDGNRVFIATDTGVFNMYMNLKLASTLKIQGDVKSIINIGSEAYILTTENIQKVSIV